MSSPARSVMVFGIYLGILGMFLILIPNLILSMFGFPATPEVWIRMVGLLTVILGMYFLYSVRHNDRIFFRATIYARVIFFTGVTVFAILGLGSPLLIGFGLIDLAGAGWTWRSLRQAQIRG